jgi:hypothetical protein
MRGFTLKPGQNYYYFQPAKQVVGITNLYFSEIAGIVIMKYFDCLSKVHMYINITFLKSSLINCKNT